MTNQQLSYEFDILWDNIFSGNAPSINEYEKSIFLTQAQKIYIEQLYNSFEKNEGNLSEINQLIKANNPTNIEDVTKRTYLLNPNSMFYMLPEDCWYIIQEHVSYDTTTSSMLTIRVIPVTQDEYNIVRTNPFRTPNNKKCWRIDINNVPLSTNSYDNSRRYVEILLDNSISFNTFVYSLRYIKKPLPIILENLTGGLAIDGISTQTEFEIDSYSAQNLILQMVVLITIPQI